MTLKILDRGYNKLLKFLLKHNEAHVLIGIQGRDASKEYPAAEGLTVAEVGSIHEFGAGVPRRSFLRDWFDENKEKLRKQMLNTAKRIVDPEINMTTRDGLGIFGANAVGEIQERITDGIFPPLASTRFKFRQRVIHRRDKSGRFKKQETKKRTTPLINTGQLLGSITWKVEE